MGTANKLTFLSTKFFTENKREYRITVTISLDDDCHNNMCDLSITADIRWKNEVRDDDYGVTLPNGTIERIIGGPLTFANEPIEIVTIKSHE